MNLSPRNIKSMTKQLIQTYLPPYELLPEKIETQINFENIFQTWKIAYYLNTTKYPANIWENIGMHSCDILFLKLGRIYLSANPEQRNEIGQFFDKQPRRTWQLVLFIRRIAKMIDSNDQIELIQIGLAIANIVASRDDFRDILISLTILMYGAEKVDINTTKLIDETISNCSIELKKILQNLKKWSENSTNLSIKKFGPKDWANSI